MSLLEQVAYWLGSILLLLLVIIFILWRWQKEPPQKPEIKSDAQGEPSPPEKNKSAPAPTASARSWRWVWWILIIAVVIYGGRWVWYETQGVKSAYSPPQVAAPQREMRVFQQFPIVIDPLSFNRTKSKKVRAGTTTDGYMTIVVDSGGEAVYDVNIIGEIPPANNPFMKIDLFLWPSQTQSVGYRVNDIRHDNIRVSQFGRETFIPRPREFHQGNNEIAFFAKGELKIDGDRKITVAR